MNKKVVITWVSVLFFAVMISGCSEWVEDLFDSSIDDEKDDPKLEELKTGAKNVTMTFKINGKTWTFNHTAYKGFNDYLASLKEGIDYDNGFESKPTKKDFIMKKLNESHQKYFLQPIINMIKNFTNDTDDRARIAVSIVQRIPYDYEGYYSGVLSNKYPYEVIYTQSGVCGEKSNLLAFLLRELGFKVAIFHFEDNNHRAVGISCQQNYDFRDTGYCFVETNHPFMITYSESLYNGSKLLDHELIKISDGISLHDISEEYQDAQEFSRLQTLSQQNNGNLEKDDYNKWLELVNKYDIKIDD